MGVDEVEANRQAVQVRILSSFDRRIKQDAASTHFCVAIHATSDRKSRRMLVKSGYEVVEQSQRNPV